MMSSSISRAPSKGRDRSNCISRAPRLIGRLQAALKFAKRNGSTSTNCRMSFPTTSERSSNARLMLEKSAADDVCYVAKFIKNFQEKTMSAPSVQLIPSAETVMQILRRTGAFREGHFVYPNGKHTAHYFQMPLAFRLYDTARVLAVALSRRFRIERDIASQLPKIAIISPSSGGIPVAFGVREALSAQQIYWAEQINGKRSFRQYVDQGDILPCIIVDDIIRSGAAIEETVKLGVR